VLNFSLLSPDRTLFTFTNIWQFIDTDVRIMTNTVSVRKPIP